MRPYRTVLEQKIRERRMTLEEFATYAEEFAREHGEPGTLSLRHLQRLAAGKGPKGQPLGPIRPATARLLERIFEMDSSDLLSSPMQIVSPPDDDSPELRERIQKARRIDTGILHALRGQLNSIRRIDRQFGAIATHGELLNKISQTRDLFAYSLTGDTRRDLAAILSEMYALAGWQALDMARYTTSWHHYEQAKMASLECGEISYRAHAAAEQALTLIDLGEAAKAVDLLKSISKEAQPHCPQLLCAWLSAAHGEALAVAGQHIQAMQLFDEAEGQLPDEQVPEKGPYVVLDRIHIARWRGHSLSYSDHSGSIALLTDALSSLDTTFNRAESSIRVDLAKSLIKLGDTKGASEHIYHANRIASEIGSTRQLTRLRPLHEN